MISNYKRKNFNTEELEWAVSLLVAEYDAEYRDTPAKMSMLIKQDFDVICGAGRLVIFFKNQENYERETRRIESGYSPEYYPD